MPNRLQGLKILVVEDEFLVAMDISDMIERHGGAVAGPATNITDAARLLERDKVDGAILDVKLDDGTSLPLAKQMVRRGQPVILTTGYAANQLPEDFAAMPRLTKPVREEALLTLMEKTFRR